MGRRSGVPASAEHDLYGIWCGHWAALSLPQLGPHRHWNKQGFIFPGSIAGTTQPDGGMYDLSFGADGWASIGSTLLNGNITAYGTTITVMMQTLARSTLSFR